MKILKYIQDDDFGKYGESMKLIDNIQVSHLGFSYSDIWLYLLSLGIHRKADSRKPEIGRG